MLKVAEKNLSKYSSEAEAPVHLSLGSSRLIRFDKRFDIIFSSISFHHWEKRAECIPYVLSRLGGFGQFILYEYDRTALSRVRKMIAGKHALSERDVVELNFDGYKTIIEHNIPYLIVRFKKASESQTHTEE